MFIKEILPDLHVVVRRDPEQQRVEGGVVELAQGDPIADAGLPLRLGIR
jgi:hypothetical protein